MKQRIVILLLILLLGGSFISLWWTRANKPIKPDDKKEVVFTIHNGESIRSVAERLQNQKLIRSSVAFFLLARFGGVANNIQAGEFRLNPSMHMNTIAQSLTHGTTDVQLTIPEGWRNSEIAFKLTQELAVPESEFLKIAREGYMFPDTYRFPKNSTAVELVKFFFDNFNRKIGQKEISLAQEKNLSLNQLIIIASLVEREAKHDVDRPIVASVILNRLKLGMKLDIDATVQYVLGYQPQEKSWWKKELTLKDLETDSPYNTYKNAGLPPQPIANPGLEAITAVLNTPKTDYLYYVADNNGFSHFASTIEEHNQNISKYLNK
ncbi:hypothetical protein A2960_04850 [Candidatus Gottesmanbacteria bacterium RIFCSPLOWO2_01_FULL_39_12b]|uniref:Endolytic murein transglycosylase n=1 Tax=Candidatus Gottesmanbacteria bacterium RIFCSPLOWO2_01_FULL_39_12b TaxID=1798388 RepID=A0A1F6ANL6_9BACT|nr:MAG: hypothetical protein A2960_04850 [Candidatus Gottesmanbacteria bacterium RIFCSPLOWO2_01_FULL_39_12b]